MHTFFNQILSKYILHNSGLYDLNPIDSCRSLIFLRFLSEEYDSNYLAIFLHTRCIIQKSLRLNMTETTQPQQWITVPSSLPPISLSLDSCENNSRKQIINSDRLRKKVSSARISGRDNSEVFDNYSFSQRTVYDDDADKISSVVSPGGIRGQSVVVKGLGSGSGSGVVSGTRSGLEVVDERYVTGDSGDEAIKGMEKGRLRNRSAIRGRDNSRDRERSRDRDQSIDRSGDRSRDKGIDRTSELNIPATDTPPHTPPLPYNTSKSLKHRINIVQEDTSPKRIKKSKIVPYTLPNNVHFISDFTVPDAPAIGFDLSLLPLICSNILYNFKGMKKMQNKC